METPIASWDAPLAAMAYCELLDLEFTNRLKGSIRQRSPYITPKETEPGGGMSTTEHPVTRSELRVELDRLRREFWEHHATKADLEALRSELKEDIGTLETRLVK